jgi:hypothetical protein
MGSNYTIYQQALNLKASGFDQFSSITIGIGVAKFLQIIFPQLAYLLTSLLLTPDRVLPVARFFFPRLNPILQLKVAEELIQQIYRLQGFFIWKLACDLGFFLIVTQYGSWLRAFTLSGLITYTLLQFVVYYLIGQRLILSRLSQRNLSHRPRQIRTTWWKNLASKLFYEEMGVTISQVSFPMILTKMIVDYVAMWITWSAYTIGFLLFANGGLSFSPFTIFPHVAMSSLYLSVYLGYAAAFTVLEILFRNIAFHFAIPSWSRKMLLSTQFKQFSATFATTLLVPFFVGVLIVGWMSLGETSSRLMGVHEQWRLSNSGNIPKWQSVQHNQKYCDSLCVKDKFLSGPYGTTKQ